MRRRELQLAFDTTVRLRPRLRSAPSTGRTPSGTNSHRLWARWYGLQTGSCGGRCRRSRDARLLQNQIEKQHRCLRQSPANRRVDVARRVPRGQACQERRRGPCRASILLTRAGWERAIHRQRRERPFRGTRPILRPEVRRSRGALVRRSRLAAKAEGTRSSPGGSPKPEARSPKSLKPEAEARSLNLPNPSTRSRDRFAWPAGQGERPR